ERNYDRIVAVCAAAAAFHSGRSRQRKIDIEVAGGTVRFAGDSICEDKCRGLCAEHKTIVLAENRVTGTDIRVAAARARPAKESKIASVGCPWLKAAGRQRVGGLGGRQRADSDCGFADNQLNPIQGSATDERAPGKGVVGGGI